MSNKIDIATVFDVIKRHKVAPPEARSIIEELNSLLAKEEAGKEETAPRQKSQYVVLANVEGTFGWVFQLPAEASPAGLLDRINASAHSFNVSKKGRLLPVKDISETLSGVPRKFFKEAGEGLALKTKEPVALIRLQSYRLSEPPTA